MAVNVKMGVDLGGFTAGIKQGQQILKGLNAEMKASEAEFKATGNAEQKMTSQTKTLNSQLNIQKNIAQQAKTALKAMTDAGVDPASAAYQKMYIQMMNAEAGANEAQAALNALNGTTQEAAAGADKLTGSLNGISKKLSLDQVISGIGKITSGLESAAKKAADLGEQLWSTIMESASRADDTSTMAEMYGIDLDTFMRMQKLVAGGMDTTVESVLKSQDKLTKGVGSGSKEVMEVLHNLHVGMREGVLEDWTSWKQKDPQKLFWEAGQAILAMGDAYEQEAAAQALFGRSWKELVPLFKQYKTLDEYNKALDEQEVNTEETIRDLAALNDAVGALESSWTTLKDELIGALAPALSEAATAIGGLLDQLTAYLKTDEGKETLTKLSNAFSTFISGLTDVNAKDVVDKFGTALDSVTNGLGWLADNRDEVIGALEGIFGVWAGLKVSSGVLTILKVINGLKDLAGLGGGAAAGGGGAVGTGLIAGLKAGIGNVAKIFPFAAPLLMGIDGILHDQQLNAEGAAQTAEERQHIAEATSEMAIALLDNAFKQTWEDATAHTMSDKAVNSDVLTDWANRYNTWITTMGDDPIMDTLVENLSEGTFSELEGLLQDVFDGATMDPGTVVDLLGKVQDELEAAGKDVELPSVLTVPDNAASLVAQQVGVVTLPVSLAMSSFGSNLANFFGIGSHANGLWSVPYDGYLARLHKGERVMPAREVQSRSYSSNLYVESMIMNNGTDAAGLAAAMAAAQRRTMSGYGS